MTDTWDCIVVGGGAAGLSAALVLGRARRRTLVIDAGEQSNRPAEGIGGLLGNDGRPPHEFYASARTEIASYPAVEIRDGLAVSAERDGEDFVFELNDGSSHVARRAVLAMGMEYRYPPLPGSEELWGRSVFHCPFCHGWEVRDGSLAVLDVNGTGAERAQLLRAWSDDVTLLDPSRVSRVRTEDGSLAAVVFDDGGELALDGLLVPVTLHQRSPLARQLGAALVSNPQSEELVEVDAIFATSVPGLFAAGDVTNRMPSVANAIAGGSTAAIGVVRDLTQLALS